MKTVLLTSILTLAVAAQFMAGNGRAEDKPVTTDEKALLKLEREWVDAEIHHDAVALKAILDDGFIATFGAGKPLNKDAFIKEITDGAVDPTVTQELSDETIIVVGDTAVIVETDTLRKTKDGRPSATAYRFTVTYIRRGDHWVALAEHGAAMKP
jgi:ketosteroid isomerase-like protein